METRIKEVPSLKDLVTCSSVLTDLLAQIMGVAAQINLRGWSEAKAGNISVNVSKEMNRLLNDENTWYLVSRSSSRYRQIAINPLDNLTLVSIWDGSEEIYPPGQKPTSEWFSHLALHQHFAIENRADSVVLHSHPNEILLMCRSELSLNDDLLSRELFRTLPEMEFFLPGGVGVVPYHTPGSIDLAASSLEVIAGKHALIWKDHGLLTFGESPDQALDRMEVIVKAVQLLLYL
jgi:rhamnulose-1-phosphate aldolase